MMNRFVLLVVAFSMSFFVPTIAQGALQSSARDHVHVEKLPACWKQSDSRKVYNAFREKGEWYALHWFFSPWEQMGVCFFYYGPFPQHMLRQCVRWSSDCAAVPLRLREGMGYGILVP